MLVLVAFVALLVRAGGESAVGAGFFAVLLLLAGPPWGLVVFLVPATYQHLPGPLSLAVFIAPAVVDLCLHAWAYLVVGRRRLARSGG